MGDERFRNALERRAQPVPPIWMMRQAGRYHRHYREMRRRHTFMDLCKEPSLAARVALSPVEDFDFDAAILFSDLLFPLEALGMGLSYDDAGPRIAWRLDDETLGRLDEPERAASHLIFQRDALRETRGLLPSDKGLIGFVGGPWTLFVYAVEGTHRGPLVASRRESALYGRFLERLVPLLDRTIGFQIEGGADVVMIFDTAAGDLPPAVFRRLVEPSLQTLAGRHPGRLGYYTRGANAPHFSGPVFHSGALAGIGLDARWEMSEALGTFRGGFVQGNFDQTLFFLPEGEFRRVLQEYLEPLARLDAAARAGWICGLGHGVLPGTPEERVREFVSTVRRVLFA